MSIKIHPETQETTQQETQETTQQETQETTQQETQENMELMKISEKMEINQIKINKLLDLYEYENTKFNLKKIKLKNEMSYELNCKINNFYAIYKIKYSLKIDPCFITLINNYTQNHTQIISLTIDLRYKLILQIANKIAKLRLKKYTLENNQQSIKDIMTQIQILEYLELESEKRLVECNAIEENYTTFLTKINESHKKECYICYESTLLYNFYECNHYICGVCYSKIENKKCPFCKSCCNNIWVK